ncbi:hypothetical protein TNCV_2552711 [Trichonephila clavipes]|nr:hypothetical protein TNCV_2552711 [Trichonephila clavipes]
MEKYRKPLSDEELGKEKHTIKANEIHRGKGLVVRLSLSVPFSIIQVTVQFGSVTPQLRERKPYEWSDASHLSSPSINLTRGDVVRRLFRVPPCRKSTIHEQTTMSSPGFEPRSYGTAVSFTNHYTGWVAQLVSNDINKNSIRHD